jgi:hypothetical protein
MPDKFPHLLLDPGYVSSSLRSQSSDHGGGGGLMSKVIPRKKKTTVADPQDAYNIIKDMRKNEEKHSYRSEHVHENISCSESNILVPNKARYD